MADAPTLGGLRSDRRGAVPDDVALAARLRQRDESALAEIYDRHAGAVYGVLVRLLGEASAQEVTQDIFLHLWEHPGAFDPARAGLRAYLLVKARSRGLDRLRATRPTTPLYADDGVELPLPDDRPGPAHVAETAQRRDRVRAALDVLSPAHRESVERAFLHGQTREEIAAHMDVPVGTVKSRITYALRHLKRVLGEEVEGWLD
ncbi:sigma-70 family RNA polymerase sigma factor [uncultured Deinococcus sp.]|uniref:sigma-70 family RNA polymerase sigma factor n=1 Tax=uncultured Deinococcus sp. TaxID=158789 RepID=UPI0025F9A321|nr:sigma-70 family RNA polymerase sigma factor [uncultured Deinococcus sp.]